MGCFFNFKRKTKIKRGVGESNKELSQRNKSDRKTTNRGIEALETLPLPRSIPELYKEKEHTLRVFTLEELKKATNGFNRTLRIGEGGFGSVYKGKLRLEGDRGDEIIVAIKRLKPNSSQVIATFSLFAAVKELKQSFNYRFCFLIFCFHFIRPSPFVLVTLHNIIFFCCTRVINNGLQKFNFLVSLVTQTW